MKAPPQSHNLGNRGPEVYNALLRCTREDNKAAPLFERINEVPGLWVLELGPFAKNGWSGWVSEVLQTLTLNEVFLKTLRDGSADFTLHVTVTSSDCLRPVTIPPALSRILASCGIGFELYHTASLEDR